MCMVEKIVGVWNTGLKNTINLLSGSLWNEALGMRLYNGAVGQCSGLREVDYLTRFCQFTADRFYQRFSRLHISNHVTFSRLRGRQAINTFP